MATSFIAYNNYSQLSLQPINCLVLINLTADKVYVFSLVDSSSNFSLSPIVKNHCLLGEKTAAYQFTGTFNFNFNKFNTDDRENQTGNNTVYNDLSNLINDLFDINLKYGTGANVSRELVTNWGAAMILGNRDIFEYNNDVINATHDQSFAFTNVSITADIKSKEFGLQLIFNIKGLCKKLPLRTIFQTNIG